MASIGKAIGALLNVSQETTLALANISCDFSIIKLEAPKEYAGLATTLSKKRIAEAEDGDIHTTARRLGYLLGQDLPDVSRLISAYGKRVTEIAALGSVNPRGTSSDGPFRDHVGADGTTIWAAATSGTEAIAAHLLACILARMWSATEAVSIWVELVDHKKQQLQESFAGESTIHSSAVFLSRIQLSRDQLAQWDSSARAWLCTADHAKRIQQTQLKLISDNISLPVSTDTKVFSSVMSCWKTAMTAMDNLIQGKPQRVQSGAILLALSAWHLYPDISVQSTSLQFIKQADPLVDQGGIITVGIQKRTNDSDDGVYWSLPLAHLRFYGKPVVTTQQNGISHTQINYAQLLCVVLGSLFGFWRILERDVDIAAEIICRLAGAYKAFARGNSGIEYWRLPTRGMGILDRAAQLYLSSQGSLRDEYARLLAYGRRRCSTFLAYKDDRPLQFYGLANVPTALRLFRSCAARRILGKHVDFLHQWTYKRKIDLTGAIICYKNDGNSFSCTSVSESWMSVERKLPDAQISSHQPSLHWCASGTANEKNTFGERLVAQEISGRFLAPGPGEQPILHELMCGDPFVAAIYRPIRPQYQTNARDWSIRPKEFLGLLQDGFLSDELLSAEIDIYDTTAVSHRFTSSLRALDVAGRIYEHLPDAKIDIQVCLRSLHASRYALRLQTEILRTGTEQQSISDMARVSLKLAFSCVILFQTGSVNVDPEYLNGAMAISHSDSIFAAQSILVDPSHLDTISPIRHIIGNIGKPGLVILMPPQTPGVRERSPGDWRVVNHAPFDGKYENNFGSTSLNLAFTGYTLAIDVGERGSLTHEAHIVETVISVYDAGEWVADLDVLKAISQYEHGWTDHAHTGTKITLPPLVSIDNWQEILDNPESSAVVRACGNEQARLAIATVASQLGYQFRIIAPGDQPKYEPKVVQSPPTSAHNEDSEDNSEGELHGSPKADLTAGDHDSLGLRLYNGSEAGSQHELDMSEMLTRDEGRFSEDGSMSSHRSTSVLYIC